MLKRSSTFVFFALFSALLSACGDSPTPAPTLAPVTVPVTVEVTRTVEITKVVEVTRVVERIITATPAPTTAAPPTSTPAPTVAPTIAPTTAAAVATTPKVSADAQMVVINSKRTEKGFQFTTPKAGFTFIVLDITLTNTTSKEISSNSFFFKVKTDANYSYDTAFSGLPKELKLSKLAPGASTRGELAFEVPQNEKLVSLNFDDFTNDINVPLA